MGSGGVYLRKASSWVWRNERSSDMFTLYCSKRVDVVGGGGEIYLRCEARR